ncbi:MAG TPA: tail fiber protein [Thermoanaerobaculia bacterium]|jgi:microcystin-dependent protein|nr:tail fiber protein [Thermoanaerobaculia bacterium]
MAQPYIGEIRMFAGNFPPAGWAFCSGQQMPISQNESLYIIIGTTYGGDGESTFNLPNLQSRVPMHMGNGPDGVTYQIGEAAGVESVTLATQQIPIHTHALIGTTNPATETGPSGNLFGISAQVEYGTTGLSADTAMNAGAITPVGGSQPHENCQPFLCINYIISLFGLFPSQT